MPIINMMAVLMMKNCKSGYCTNKETLQGKQLQNFKNVTHWHCFMFYKRLNFSKLTRKQPNIEKDPIAIYGEGGRGGPEWKPPSDLTPVQLQLQLRKMEKMMSLITGSW